MQFTTLSLALVGAAIANAAVFERDDTHGGKFDSDLITRQRRESRSHESDFRPTAGWPLHLVVRLHAGDMLPRIVDYANDFGMY